MAFADSIDDDLLMCASDDPRTGTYYQRTGYTTYGDAQTVTGVFREPPSRQDFQAGLVTLDKVSAIFHLQSSQLSHTPADGDKYVDDDATNWIVDHWEKHDEGKRYRLICYEEA